MYSDNLELHHQANGADSLVDLAINYLWKRRDLMSKIKFLLMIIILLITVSGCSKSDVDDNFKSLEELNQPQYTIAAQVGAASEPYVGKVFPNAVEKQFPNFADMIVALEQKKVDGVVFTRATLETVLQEKPDKFQILDQALGQTDIHMVISPNTQLKNLQNEVNEFLKAKKEDGTLEKAYKYWCIDHNIEMPPDIPQSQGATKKLVVGTDGTMMPVTFYSGDQLVGFDIEIIKRFAAEYGYEIEFRVEDFVPLLADAEFGKVDIISGSVMYTEERAERVIFPETPLFSLPISIMVRKNSEQQFSENIFTDLGNSFEKTLIREDRYKMILDGLKVTLIIASGSLILGTILGFIFCILKRSKIKIISMVMKGFIALMAGLPMVLTLMICFYIVFSNTGLNEIIVAIIAFSLDFGCHIAVTLNSGIESVSKGEIEAAEALGLKKLQIYGEIVLPQAIQKIFGVYSRQVISMIKSTAVVGYIAVQDLTKVSDIIRARTYEAFFSLIFTAAIYFIIARICIYLLNKAEKSINRRRR